MLRFSLRRLSFFAPLLFSFLISSPLAQQTKDIFITPKIEKELKLGERYALLIGIGKYKDKRIPPLKYTVNDAKAMYEVLTDPRHGMFPKDKVKLLLEEQATRESIMMGFSWLRRNAKPEDTVIVFYSGHGGPEEEGTYWVSYDANIDDLSATAVSNGYIVESLGKIRSKRLITFMDSCYSAAIAQKKDAPKALFDRDFFAKYKGEGRISITASDGKQLSLEAEEFKHGVFTYYLVEALKGKADRNQDGAVELEEVWEHVRNRVTDAAQKRGNKQEPTLIGQLKAGLLVSLNPSVLETEKARLEELKKLLGKDQITGTEYDEAKKVLGGEGEARLLDLVRNLADGKILPKDYRHAKVGALAAKAEEKPARKPPEMPGEKPEETLKPRPEGKDEKVASLLDRADSQFKRRRYTSPKGDNAYETLQEVLRLDPGNEGARKKLEEMAEIYRRWGKEDFERKNFAAAKQNLQKLLSIFPEDRGAQDQLAAIERAERGETELRARQERERREAEARAERERLARLEQERREREERERREREVVERRPPPSQYIPYIGYVGRPSDPRPEWEERERKEREDRERLARIQEERRRSASPPPFVGRPGMQVASAISPPTSFPYSSEKLTFALNWIAYGVHAPYYAGKDLGFFKKYGLDVEIIRGFGGADTIKKVSMNSVNFGLGDATALVSMRSRGDRARIIGIILAKGENAIYALRGSGISSPRDLVGKAGGASPGAQGYLLFPALMRANGVPADSVRWVLMAPPAQIPSLLAGTVEFIADWVTTGPNLTTQARRQGKDVVEMKFSDWGLDLYGMGLIASDQTIQNNPNLVKKFVTASMEAWGWSLHNRAQAVSSFLRQRPEMPRDMVEAHHNVALGHLVDQGVAQNGLGWVDHGKMQTTRDVVTTYMKLSTVVPVNDIYSNEFLPGISPR